ncbi:hypothetical protein HDU97_004909 [Phlyctochytrium planicorne]|nr:hypothetical protein HDU97_004909 [Phlyctochytrium planicorne]
MKSIFFLTAVVAAALASTVVTAQTAFDPNGDLKPGLGDTQCIDDTTFRTFKADGSFNLTSCAKGFCQTRKPRRKNPCIGAANAARIDGFTLPGTEGGGAGAGKPPVEGAAVEATVAEGAQAKKLQTAFDPNGDLKPGLGDTQCIDDTTFRTFKADGSFTLSSCAKGFCQTRKPRRKNPCIGAANAARIDGFTLPVAVSNLDNAKTGTESIAGANSDNADDQSDKDQDGVFHPPQTEATAFDPNGPETPFGSNDFQCIDDATFRHFKADGSFTLGSCAKGFCQTRKPRKKNPCIVKEAVKKEVAIPWLFRYYPLIAVVASCIITIPLAIYKWSLAYKDETLLATNALEGLTGNIGEIVFSNWQYAALGPIMTANFHISQSRASNRSFAEQRQIFQSFVNPNGYFSVTNYQSSVSIFQHITPSTRAFYESKYFELYGATSRETKETSEITSTQSQPEKQ